MIKKFVISQISLGFVLFYTIGALWAELDTSSYFADARYSKKISMDFRDARLNDVLKIFSQQSSLNFIASQEISDLKVNLYLNEVPVEEAIEKILKANNLTYSIQPGSDIFIVEPIKEAEKKLQTRIFQLKHATVSNSKLKNTIKVESDAQSSQSSQSSDDKKENIGVMAAIQTLLSNDGSIVEDARTNSLIISDYSERFPAIEETIAKLDVPIPQILIEVEMLDISKNSADKIGVKYGDTIVSFSGAQRSHLYPWNQNSLLNKNRFAFASTDTTSTSSSSSSDETQEFTAGTIDASGATLLLQFLRTQSDTRSLARPRILTLNNETAQIRISTNEAIGIQTQTNSSEGVATQSVEAERVQTGIFLTVTPQANLLSNEITMAIAPKVIQAKTGSTFQGQTFRDPEERGTQSILKIPNGDTIIMGGLIRNEVSDTITKLPLLGDIPIVGAAFRHKDKTDVERELIIFITPYLANEKTLLETTASNVNPPIFREQDIPKNRSKEIDKALSIFEKHNL